MTLDEHSEQDTVVGRRSKKDEVVGVADAWETSKAEMVKDWPDLSEYI